jgi:multiple sugar transport system substrate-binding protein
MASLVRRLAAAASLAAALAPAGVAGQQATELRVVVPRYSDETRPLLEAVASAFEFSHPGVEVTVDVVPWEGLFQKLTADISAGAPPDLAVIASAWLPDLAGEGVLEPLEGHIDPALEAAVIPALLAPTRLDGGLMGLPFAASVRALYYNEALFEAAGIPSPPADWDALAEAAAAIAATGEGIAGFGLQGAAIETDVYFYHALWSLGGDILDDEGRSGLAAEPAIAAAAMYRRFIDEGLTQPDVTAFGRADLQALFAAGRLGMVIAAPPFAAELTSRAPSLRFGIAPVPAGVTRATYGITDSIVMFRDAPTKDAAARFLGELFRNEWRVAFATREQLLPTTTAAAASRGVRDDPVLAPFAGLLRDARFTPPLADWEVAADLTSAALRRIYLGEAEPAEALAAAAAEIDAVFAP